MDYLQAQKLINAGKLIDDRIDPAETDDTDGD